MQVGKLPKSLTSRLRAILGPGALPRTVQALTERLVDVVERRQDALKHEHDQVILRLQDLCAAEVRCVAAERQRDEARAILAKLPENGRVTTVTLGSSAHDGHGFFTIGFEFDSGAQAASVPWMPESMAMINGIIRACGARDLFDCKGKYVRVLRAGVGWSPIIGITHIVDSNNSVYFKVAG